MVIDHAGRLHVSINDRRANKRKSPPLEILAERVGYRRGRWNVADVFPPVLFWVATYKLPSVGPKCSELLLNLEERSRVANGRFNFQSVSNDVRVLEQFGDVFVRISRYLRGIKIAKCPAISFALVEDYKPVEAGLGTLQNEKLKMVVIIACRDAPLMVVITYHQGLARGGPGASRWSTFCACRPQDARLPVLLNLKGAIRRRDLLGIVGAHSRQARVGDTQFQKQVTLERQSLR